MFRWIRQLFQSKRKPFVDTDPRSNTQRLSDFNLMVNNIMAEERRRKAEELTQLRARVAELEAEKEARNQSET